jgi:hypothetical protein
MPQPSLGAGAMPPLGAKVKTPPYGRGYLGLRQRPVFATPAAHIWQNH